jgi:hypothetical protein
LSFKTNWKHVARGCGGTQKRPGVVERRGQPVENSNELDHTNSTKRKR